MGHEVQVHCEGQLPQTDLTSAFVSQKVLTDLVKIFLLSSVITVQNLVAVCHAMLVSPNFFGNTRGPTPLGWGRNDP